MIALSCWCVSFMLSLFSNFLNYPSFISPQCSSASSLSSPFHLEHWHPPSSVIVFHRRRTESASSSIHHTKPLVYCYFWFLPDVPRPDLHLPHILFPNSQVALCSPSLFSSGLAVAYEHLSMLHLWSFHFPHSGHSCGEAHRHYQSSSYFTVKPAYMISFLMSALLE